VVDSLSSVWPFALRTCEIINQSINQSKFN
ncbi:hypothetical protein VN97_g12966, partial [Penicillium thymicola]